MAERSTNDTIVMLGLLGAMLLSGYFIITSDPSVPHGSRG